MSTVDILPVEYYSKYHQRRKSISHARFLREESHERKGVFSRWRMFCKRSFLLCQFQINCINLIGSSNSTNYSRSYGPRIGWLALAGAVATGAGTVYCLTASKPFKIKTPFILRAASEDEKEVEVKTKLTLKQKKFDEYASYEYGGNRLMSPNDFLDSLIDYEGTV